MKKYINNKLKHLQDSIIDDANPHCFYRLRKRLESADPDDVTIFRLLLRAVSFKPDLEGFPLEIEIDPLPEDCEETEKLDLLQKTEAYLETFGLRLLDYVEEEWDEEMWDKAVAHGTPTDACDDTCPPTAYRKFHADFKSGGGKERVVSYWHGDLTELIENEIWEEEGLVHDILNKLYDFDTVLKDEAVTIPSSKIREHALDYVWPKSSIGIANGLLIIEKFLSRKDRPVLKIIKEAVRRLVLTERPFGSWDKTWAYGFLKAAEFDSNLLKAIDFIAGEITFMDFLLPREQNSKDWIDRILEENQRARESKEGEDAA